MAKNDYEKLLTSCGAMSGTQYYEKVKALPVLSFGVFSVDLATGKRDPELGNGGVRARDLVEIFGKPGAGKTALLESLIRTTQERYPDPNAVVMLASEGADIPRMERVGIDVEKLLLIGASTKDSKKSDVWAENALNNVLKLSEFEQTKLVVIDSVGALVTEKQFDKEIGEAMPVAAVGNVFNQFVADYSKVVKIAPLVYLNFYKEPIKTGFSFVTPSPLEVYTKGGTTKDFLSMMRIRADSYPAYRKDGSDYVKHSITGARIQDGLNINYTLIRNKYSNKDASRVCKTNFGFGSCKFDNEVTTLNYAESFTKLNEKGELVSQLDPPVIQKGAWYYIGGEKLQGRDNAVAYLEAHPEILFKLQTQIMPYSQQFFSDADEFSVDEILG